MFSPTVRHRCWKVTVDPVKWMPARSRCGSATVDTACPSPVTRLITPGGSPAASSRRIVTCAASCWVGEGFHTTTLPSRAGAVGRLPAIEVKLNGVIARMKPSSGRYSIRFQIPGEDIGCSSSSRRAKWTLNRQKSISSQAASISAWYTDLDWPAIVAALTVARNGPLSRSAARSRIAARSSKDIARQPGAAVAAASIASATSCSVALFMVPSTCRKLCGATTSIGCPPPNRWLPPMVMVSSARSPVSSLTLPSSAARSALPGGYCLIGSLTGGGTVVTASMTASLSKPGIAGGHSMVARGGHHSHSRGHGEHEGAVVQCGDRVAGCRGPAGVQGGEQCDAERAGQPLGHAEQCVGVGHLARAEATEQRGDQRLDGQPQGHAAPAEQRRGHPERGRGGEQQHAQGAGGQQGETTGHAGGDHRG